MCIRTLRSSPLYVNVLFFYSISCTKMSEPDFFNLCFKSVEVHGRIGVKFPLCEFVINSSLWLLRTIHFEMPLKKLHFATNSTCYALLVVMSADKLLRCTTWSTDLRWNVVDIVDLRRHIIFLFFYFFNINVYKRKNNFS